MRAAFRSTGTGIDVPLPKLLARLAAELIVRKIHDREIIVAIGRT